MRNRRNLAGIVFNGFLAGGLVSFVYGCGNNLTDNENTVENYNGNENSFFGDSEGELFDDEIEFEDDENKNENSYESGEPETVLNDNSDNSFYNENTSENYNVNENENFNDNYNFNGNLNDNLIDNHNDNYNVNENSSSGFETGYGIDNREECEEKNGVWSYWGLSDEESCNIRASDAGKECYDGSECEGECITECMDKECHANEGVCSKFRRYFGCTRFWNNGEISGYILCID